MRMLVRMEHEDRASPRGTGISVISRWNRLTGSVQNFTDRIPTMGPLSRKDRREWYQAESIADLCELTARWLDRGIDTCPYHHDGPDEETEELVPSLVAMNRSGLLTYQSHPGGGPFPEPDGNNWWQRAFVDGITDQTTADRISDKLLGSGLIVIRHHGASQFMNFRSSVPVSGSDRHHRRDGIDSGQQMSRRQLGRMFDGLAFDELCAAEQVSVIDPKWGRNDHLWDTVNDALTLELEIPEQVARERIEIDHRIERLGRELLKESRAPHAEIELELEP